MYKIEYYKNRVDNFSDEYSNIKSLTIDIADIKEVIFDLNKRNLIALYDTISRMNTNGVRAITILNNNMVNHLYIKEIINCDWMINRNSITNSDEIIIKKIKEINTLIKLYEESKNIHTKNKLDKKIELLKYYINSLYTLKNIDEKENTNLKVLKLGVKFIQ